MIQLDVQRQEVALFVRRFLKHTAFDTQAKRMGAVVRASHVGLSVWRLHAEKEVRLDWEYSRRSSSPLHDIGCLAGRLVMHGSA